MIDALNRNTSWNAMPIEPRSTGTGMSAVSIPSIRISPPVGAMNRGSSLTVVLLPAPLGPTIATRSPDRIARSTPRITSVPGSNPKRTLRNSIEPDCSTTPEPSAHDSATPRSCTGSSSISKTRAMLAVALDACAMSLMMHRTAGYSIITNPKNIMNSPPCIRPFITSNAPYAISRIVPIPTSRSAVTFWKKWNRCERIWLSRLRSIARLKISLSRRSPEKPLTTSIPRNFSTRLPYASDRFSCASEWLRRIGTRKYRLVRYCSGRIASAATARRMFSRHSTTTSTCTLIRFSIRIGNLSWMKFWILYVSSITRAPTRPGWFVV